MFLKQEDLAKYWLAPYMYGIDADDATEGSGGGETSTEGDGGTAEAEGTEADSKTAATATETKPEAEAKKPWFMDRIDGLTRRYNDAERRCATYEGQNKALRTTIETLLAQGSSPREAAAAAAGVAGEMKEGNAAEGVRPTGDARLYTQAELLDEARKLAAAAVQEQTVTAAETAFNTRCNEVAAAAKAKYPDFDTALSNLGAAGVLPRGDAPLAHQPGPRAFLEAITSLDEAPQVLNHLGKNPEEAIRIAGMTPVAMAVALAKLGNKLGAEPAVRGASKAPAPVTTVNGTGTPGAPSLEDESMSLSDWIKMRDKNVQEARRH